MKNPLQNFYKNNFVYSTKEKLSKLTSLAISILNLIVFLVLMEGLDFQTNFVSHPNNIYSSKCSSIINSNTNDFNSYSYRKDNDFYDNYNNNEYRNFETKKDLLDDRCKIIDIKINEVLSQNNIDELRTQDQELFANINKLEDELNYLRNNYNTVLFEKIATQDLDKSIIDGKINSENIKQKYDALTKNYEILKEQKESLKNNFEQNNKVKELSSYVDSIKEKYLTDEKEEYNFYFYKVEFVKLIFLLPLVIAFFYLMKKYMKEEKYILYLIFKNILIVSLIPTLYTVFTTIYKILPKVFIASLIEFFYNLDIPFVVYYLLIIVFVIIFIFIIIKLQKRFKEQNEKLKNNKISKIEFYNQDKCNSCGNKVSYSIMNYCPICVNKLKVECKNCNKLTIAGLNFCQNCGNSLKD